MKIAIFTISLGKYDIFFKDFYESVNEKFLPNHDKTFFVFTDKKFEDRKNIIQIHQDKMGWPYDSMMRFHLLNKIKDEIIKYDYVFFFNVNMFAVQTINEEVLPDESNDFLMGCNHPLHFHQAPHFLPYERNKEISCAINFTEGKYYYQGCFNGGRTKEFLEMSETLSKNVDEDLKKNLETYVSTAESNLNIYLYEGHEQEIQWLLTIAKMADIILLDIDNASEDVTHFLSYIISIPTTYYRCNHKNVPWDLLNQNRFFDFPKLNED